MNHTGDGRNRSPKVNVMSWISRLINWLPGQKQRCPISRCSQKSWINFFDWKKRLDQLYVQKVKLNQIHSLVSLNSSARHGQKWNRGSVTDRTGPEKTDPQPHRLKKPTKSQLFNWPVNMRFGNGFESWTDRLYPDPTELYIYYLFTIFLTFQSFHLCFFVWDPLFSPYSRGHQLTTLSIIRSQSKANSNPLAAWYLWIAVLDRPL